MNLYYFRLIAQEKSISKAARKAFVSQQSLSKYLKRLEEKYDVKLFERRPYMKLTCAGELLMEHSLSIDNLELNLNARLLSLSKPDYAQIRLGLPRSFAFAMLPHQLTLFKSLYPNINISVLMGKSGILQDKLINGELDLLIGLDVIKHPRLSYDCFLSGKYKLAISEEALKKYFLNSYKDFINKKCKTINIQDFKHVPFVGSNEVAREYNIIKSFLEHKKVFLKFGIIINYATLQLTIASASAHACIYQGFFNSYIEYINQNSKPEKRLYTFDIYDLDYSSNISLVWNGKQAIKQQHTQFLINLIKDTIYL